MPRNAAVKKEKASRLEARIDSQLKALFERAAALRGCTLSNFIVDSTREAAVKTIREHEIIKLVGPDRDAFIAALIKPPKPTRKMIESARRYKKEVGV